MNKLKMLVLTALAAATVGTGALAAAPSASAMPNCDYYESKSIMNDAQARLLWAYGLQDLARVYFGRALAYEEMWRNCMGFGH